MTRPWTEAEISELIELVNAGRKRREIAKILGRTPKSIESKLRDIRKKSRDNDENILATDKMNKNNNSKENIEKSVGERNDAIILYRKFLRKFLQKDSLPEREFDSLANAVEEYYLKTKNLNGAILLLETIMESGKY
ncbi:DNA binding HTH-domain protein [Thermus phage YS40_Isch]|nr:DNA binding HTH-domain protein [Thermus phage YS40_Isch]